ncbi:MAG: hypothetical protein ACFFG0_27045 [Candidatus Thorarchaeota archaeon]
MEKMTTDFFKKDEDDGDSDLDSPELMNDDLILKSSSKEFKPSGLYTQIEDEIKMARLRKKYRKNSP